MITTLLWRCPACGTDDTLRYRKGWFRPARLSCTNCSSEWAIRRVFGQDYQLKVTCGNDGLVGQELALTEWYDRMKAGLTLQPRNDSMIPLQEGEALYLQCGRSELVASSGNPLLKDWVHGEAPVGPIPDELVPKWSKVGKGRLCLTSDRLVWQSERKSCDLFWRRVQSVFTFHTLYLGVVYGATVYRFSTPGQSILKWLTYTGKISEELQARGDRSISLSYY